MKANRRIYSAYQYVYNISPASPWWEKALFWVYCRFNEFFHDKLGFVAYTHIDDDGKRCWIERQGHFFDKWRAQQEAAKYPYGFVLDLPLDESLPAESYAPVQVHPNGKTKIYDRVGRETVPVPLAHIERLKESLRATAPRVAQYHDQTV